MSEIADLIADLARAGVAPDLIGRVAAALADRGSTTPEAGRSSRQERNRRYYERRMEAVDLVDERLNSDDSDAERLNKTPAVLKRLNSDDLDASPSPSPKPKVSPGPPSKTQPSSPPSNPLKGPFRPKTEVESIWAITPRTGRERSSRKDVERALGAAIRRGHDPADVLRGLVAYYASAEATRDGGQFAKGAHRLIECDRWQEFAAADAEPDDDGPAIRNPSEIRQRAWAADWRDHPGQWLDHVRGPPPGQPGCRISPAVQVEVLGGSGALP